MSYEEPKEEKVAKKVYFKYLLLLSIQIDEIYLDSTNVTYKQTHRDTDKQIRTILSLEKVPLPEPAGVK